MKRFAAIVISCLCIVLSACAAGDDGITQTPENTAPAVSKDIVSDTVPAEEETVAAQPEEPDAEPETAEAPAEESGAENTEDSSEQPVREMMYGETAALVLEFVDFQELLDELEWAEIQLFDWQKTDAPLGIACVENADDIASIAEMLGTLTLEKMDYMEPTVRVFKIYLYGADDRAALVTIDPTPWINDYRITDGELDFDLLYDVFEKNK